MVILWLCRTCFLQKKGGENPVPTAGQWPVIAWSFPGSALAAGNPPPPQAPWPQRSWWCEAEPQAAHQVSPLQPAKTPKRAEGQKLQMCREVVLSRKVEELPFPPPGKVSSACTRQNGKGTVQRCSKCRSVNTCESCSHALVGQVMGLLEIQNIVNSWLVD